MANFLRDFVKKCKNIILKYENFKNLEKIEKNWCLTA